jgi:hypothetical protein
VALDNFCPNCGAALAPGASVPPRDKLLIQRAVALAAIAILAVLALLLLLVLPTGSLFEDNCDICTVTFHNKTDAHLCFGDSPCSTEEIKPRVTSEAFLDSCFGEREVTVFTPDGRELYSRVALCDEWTIRSSSLISATASSSSPTVLTHRLSRRLPSAESADPA